MRNKEALFTSNKQDWRTPRSFFDEINNQLKFDVDIAANAENSLCPDFTDDYFNCAGLQDKILWCNPPYNKIAKFVSHAIINNHKVCFLVPARTDTRWFHCFPYGTQVYLLRGRLKFSGASSFAPFPSCLILLNITTKLKLSMPNIRFVIEM